MTTECRPGVAPPACCQPPVSAERQARLLDRFDSIAATVASERPSRCPWLGHGAVIPVFVSDRRSWECLDCRREFTTGVTG